MLHVMHMSPYPFWLKPLLIKSQLSAAMVFPKDPINPKAALTTYAETRRVLRQEQNNGAPPLCKASRGPAVLRRGIVGITCVWVLNIRRPA